MERRGEERVDRSKVVGVQCLRYCSNSMSYYLSIFLINKFLAIISGSVVGSLVVETMMRILDKHHI